MGGFGEPDSGSSSYQGEALILAITQQLCSVQAKQIELETLELHLRTADSARNHAATWLRTVRRSGFCLKALTHLKEIIQLCHC